MSIVDMVKEWKKGCSNSMSYSETGAYLGQHLEPWKCQDCTEALINAIENKANKESL